jgi:integrase
VTEHVSKKVVDRNRAEGVAALLKRWFKNTPLEEVDIPACRAYAAARMKGELVSPIGRKDGAGKGGRPVTESTARRELGVLAAAAGHAARWKRIGPAAKPVTPMPSIELPPGGAPRTVFLTKEELARVIDAASGRLKDFIMVLYYTAARRRSVERLTRFQVDLRAGTINLTSPTESDNERRSKKRRPTVPIDAKIRPIIDRLYAESKLANNEWLWGDDKDMYGEFSDHMIALGLANKKHPHVLRHSRATHLLQAGKSIYTVAKLLGDSVATVDRVYGHHALDDLAVDLAESGT